MKKIVYNLKQGNKLLQGLNICLNVIVACYICVEGVV
jgi:hypothetical protein